MRSTDQKKYIETLKRYENKFTSEELKDYKMFSKRHKDDEDLVLENCFHGYHKQCFLDYVLR